MNLKSLDKNKLKTWIIVILAITNLISITFLVLPLLSKSEFEVYSAITIEGLQSNATIAEIENVEWQAYNNQPILTPSLDTENCGDAGNIYAPDILIEDNKYHMWYGGQDEHGHDQIHYATSDDGEDWVKRGVVVPNNDNNHVNDPSVVKVDETYYMFYTTAPEGIMDVVSLATSTNGINWTIYGNVFLPSSEGNWDSLKVGRPSVLYEDGMFKMWYDGNEIDPLNPTEPKPGTHRHVGYATSYDGITWTRNKTEPIVLYSGAVDVEHIDNDYIMVIESQLGVYWCKSSNETNFDSPKILFNKTGLDWDKYGHVTPFILNDNGYWVATYVGVTPDSCWCQNRIGVWYPMLKIEMKNKNMEKLMPSYKHTLSRSTLVVVFENTKAIKNTLCIENDESWICSISIYDETNSELINQRVTILKNEDFYNDNGDFIKNQYFLNKERNYLVGLP